MSIGRMDKLASVQGEPIRIMSVEDDELAYRLLKRTVIRDAGLDCDFHWANTVDDALQFLQSEQVHLCFIDYKLGAEDGFDLIRRLPPHQEFTPCILLTGLYNRAAFTDHLEQMFRRRRRSGVEFGAIYLDLDRFKAINDSAGHQAGDLVLVEVAERLRCMLRETDVIARLGGDEFAICCSDIASLDGLSGIASKLVSGLAEPFEIDGIPYKMSCSVGIAMADGDIEEAGHFMQATDIAMYEAKRSGGNRFSIHRRNLSEQFERRMQIERGLAHALADDRLCVAFQPIVNLQDGSIQAVEALARWHDENLGDVSPGEFISVAEHTGLISAVGIAVFQQACKDLKTLVQVPGFEQTRVALNLSVRQLASPALVPALQSLLDDAGISPQQVEFEVTEGFFEADEKTIIEQVWRLKNMGARISVDDFGTGYSSLSRLQNYPIDAFKIDQSFVSGIGRSEAERRLCSAIVELGHALQIEVIAEGVETTEQLEFLRQTGCGFAQGYLLSRPKPVRELAAQGPISIAAAIPLKPFH